MVLSLKDWLILTLCWGETRIEIIRKEIRKTENVDETVHDQIEGFKEQSDNGR